MRLEDFDYVLPEERIAQHPVEPRDSARLLVDQGSGVPLHRHVRDLGEFLRDGDLLVVNDTKVIPARLRLQRVSGGAAEALLLEPLDAERRTWEAMVRPAKKLKAGEELLSANTSGTCVPLVRVVRRSEAGDTMIIELVGEGDPLALLHQHGEMPLPPYINVSHGIGRSAGDERYQTVYANEPASGRPTGPAFHARADGAARRPASRPGSWWWASTRPAGQRSRPRDHVIQRALPVAPSVLEITQRSVWCGGHHECARPRSELALACSSTARTSGRWSTC
jgi:S-adenosylmethionine:tRNA ribosyltransferase-isomerase